MCLRPSAVRPYQKWHWAGDEIVPDPIVPASRTIPGSGLSRYPIDIREYISIEGNAVIRGEIDRLRASLRPADRLRFGSREPGAFDFRADCVMRHLRALEYRRHATPSRRAPVRPADYWLYPHETLAERGGDCEDLAFVAAALLEASGISPYCIRVALGRVHDRSAKKSYDHAWVVYQDEIGAWEILEPIAAVAPPQPKAERLRGVARGFGANADVEYVPHFVFNRHHLWRVRSEEREAGLRFRDYVEERDYFDRFDPSFAASVHDEIYALALDGMPEDDLSVVRRASFWVDVNVLAYDPRDHFDFAYVEESWERVEWRLATGKLGDLGLALHAIGDFYSHTLYGEFGEKAGNRLVPYHVAEPIPPSKLAYDFGPYAPLSGCKKKIAESNAHWRGKLVSGQWWRWYSSYPDELDKPSELAWRRCLPDHDRLAVDGPKGGGGDHRYDKAAYAEQFRLRRAATIEHCRDVYQAWRVKSPAP